MEKLNRAQKCSILGPQNPGSWGAQAPRPPCIRIWLFMQFLQPPQHQCLYHAIHIFQTEFNV